MKRQWVHALLPLRSITGQFRRAVSSLPGPAVNDHTTVVPRTGPVGLAGLKPVRAAEASEPDPSRLPRLNRLPWAVLL